MYRSVSSRELIALVRILLASSPADSNARSITSSFGYVKRDYPVRSEITIQNRLAPSLGGARNGLIAKISQRFR